MTGVQTCALPISRETNRKYLVTAYKYLIQNSISKKDDVKAKEHAAKVLELDPNDKDAKEFLNPTVAPAQARPAPATKPAGKKSTGK